MQANLVGLRQSVAEFRQRWNQARAKKSVVFWIAVGAVVLTLILGFTRGGWTTAARAENMAETSAQGAVLQRLTPICVAQFDADPQWASKLDELKALSTYKRATYVEEQGWATMPGETGPDGQVARECAKRLALTIE
jgi:hypothetical protein